MMLANCWKQSFLKKKTEQTSLRKLRTTLLNLVSKIWHLDWMLEYKNQMGSLSCTEYTEQLHSRVIYVVHRIWYNGIIIMVQLYHQSNIWYNYIINQRLQLKHNCIRKMMISVCIWKISVFLCFPIIWNKRSYFASFVFSTYSLKTMKYHQF